MEALQAATANTNTLRQELAARESPDDDSLDYLNAMIAGVLDGYTGILYGLKDAEANDAAGAVDAA